MSERKKKVILVSGKKSGWYEQAIFIVNEGNRLPVDMVKEAENIIRKYIAAGGDKKDNIYEKYKNNMKNKKRSNIDESAKNEKQYSIPKTGVNAAANTAANIAIAFCMVLICFLMYMVFKL